MNKKETRRQKADEENVAAESAPRAVETEKKSASEMEDMFADLGSEMSVEESAESKEKLDENELGKRRLESALRSKGLSPRFALELVADYDPEAIDDQLIESLAERTKEYGLDFATLPEDARQELLVMSAGAARGRSEKSKEVMNEAVESAIHHELFLRATQQIDGLEAGLAGNLEMGELKDRLRQVMESMNSLSKKI